MKEGFAEAKGRRIHYVENGVGRPTLLIHGNTGSLRWYERVMELPGCRCIALDLPNFGSSEPLEAPVEIEGYADAVIAFAEALALERPVLVAHSFGGAVAMSMVARLPGAWSGLVLVDSASPSGLVTPPERHPYLERMRTEPAVLARALRAVVPTLRDEPFFEALVGDAARMAKAAWIGNAEALSRFTLAGRLAVFTAPVLVLWGRKDPIVTEAMARETAAAFPASRLEILETPGHSVMVEDPRLFAALVAVFVQGIG